jgi:hypothetical protein
MAPLALIHASQQVQFFPITQYVHVGCTAYMHTVGVFNLSMVLLGTPPFATSTPAPQVPHTNLDTRRLVESDFALQILVLPSRPYTDTADVGGKRTWKKATQLASIVD